MNKPFATTLAIAASAVLAACSASHADVAPLVSKQLQPPAGQALVQEVDAVGVQIYNCGPAKADPQRFEWAFKAPEARLYDKTGAQVGRHYAGPTWESSDRSIVVGELVAREDSPEANAIPWLLLKAKSASGEGVYARTRSILRVRTSGGLAPPAVACNQNSAGTEVRVPYKAVYYFYDQRA